MLERHFTLLDDKGRTIAAGSWDAIRAVARLFWGPNVRLVNRFEQEIFARLDERILQDIDRSILSECL